MTTSNKILLSAVIFIFMAICSTPAFCADEAEPEYSSVEERRLHNSIQLELDNIENQRKVLLMREKDLKTLEDGVDKKLTEIDKKLEELKSLKKQIETLLAKKNAEEVKKIKNLSAIYEKMDPGKAAFALTGLDDELATRLLANMKVKAAAKIMELINKQKATQLSKRFSKIQLE